MPNYSYEGLKKKTVAQLREIAKGIDHEAVKGATQMNKEHLLKGICAALNIDMHIHHHVEGLDKQKVKSRIKELKLKRKQALEASDHASLKIFRRKIHRLKRKLHNATV